MKKRLMVLLILALSLSVAGGALAAKFPGATVGFQWGVTNVYTILTLKLNGTAKMDSPIKFYTVSGVTFDTTNPPAQYPVSGTAYVKGPAGNQTLIFSLSGTLALLNNLLIWKGSYPKPTGLGRFLFEPARIMYGELRVRLTITVLTADQIKALVFP